MNIKITIAAINYLIFSLLILVSCENVQKGNIRAINHQPLIIPDYQDITIPPNIAPLNFTIKEPGKEFRITLKSGIDNEQISLSCEDGKVHLPEKSWKKLVGGSAGNKISIQILSVTGHDSLLKYEPITIYVAKEPIDPYLAYRLIPPGYYSWSEIKIEQRCLESFETSPVIENQIIEKNCVNCHSFNQNNPDQFLLHIRGSKGGTYFAENGKITKTNLKTDKMNGGATYPYWHPGGRFVVFSSNQVKQSFYANHDKSIEVYDQSSFLLLYDIHKNAIIDIPKIDSTESLQTFPAWSPDGKTLFYCEANLKKPISNLEINDIKNIHYNLVKKKFNETDMTFGETEMVINGNDMHKSVSFPRISPDGKFLILTLADYGTFPIWHQEADLYMLDIQSGKLKKMNINSNESDSYHSWSSNSKWLVFSSKRLDGRSTRPFIAYIGSIDETGKPFVLPQEDPDYYEDLVQSYNIPELIKGKIKLGPRDFEAAATLNPVQAKPGIFKNEAHKETGILINNQPVIPNSVHE